MIGTLKKDIRRRTEKLPMTKAHKNQQELFHSEVPYSVAYEVTRFDLEETLDAAVGKTLGEVDAANVFDRTKTNPKITGIAGDVVEQSILGYPPNSAQEPDLIVDGEPTELKTTGLRRSKKKRSEVEAKEPMSITAVSIDKIADEEFEDSSFFHKIRKMLIVYYLYDADHTASAAEYADFPIEGYQFHEFTAAEQETLKNDWQLVHDFIARIQRENPDEEARKALYPKLSSELRRDLMLIDTAPKFPHPPRFRLKRSAVTEIARKKFGRAFEQLPHAYTSYSEIDRKLHEIAKQHKGQTMERIGYEYGVLNLKAKNAPESIVVRLFGGKGKMSDIDLFSKIGLNAKSVTLTKKGARTEDMKLLPIDFNELTDPNITFEESSFYSYFSDNQFLLIVFEEPSHDAPLGENILKGFKRLSFDEAFIQDEVRSVWEEARRLIFENELRFIPEIDKKTGEPKVNATGVIKGAPNFPKSKDGRVFIRGTGRDSSRKPVCINGIEMYRQNVWVRGSYIASRMEELPWL